MQGQLQKKTTIIQKTNKQKPFFNLLRHVLAFKKPPLLQLGTDGINPRMLLVI